MLIIRQYFTYHFNVFILLNLFPGTFQKYIYALHSILYYTIAIAIVYTFFEYYCDAIPICA